MTRWMAPSWPVEMRERICRERGKKRVQTASMRKRLRERAVAMRARAWAALVVKDFSQRTGLLARRQSMVFW